MATIKKYNGSSWENVVVRKFGTATEAVENPLYSDGTAITSYTLKGNTVQDGTPTPSNPVEVIGVGERTENLLNPNSKTTNQSGVVRFGGEFPAGTYYIYNGFNETIYYRDGVSSTSSTSLASNRGIVLSFTNALVVWHSSGLPTDTIMVAESSEAIPFEPYGQFKIPISNGQQTTNIYLGSTQTVRQIKKVVFDGTETWGATGAGIIYYGAISDYIRTEAITCACSHFQAVTNRTTSSTSIDNSVCFGIGEYNRIFIKCQYTTDTDFKQFLAQQYANGTPVTIWYILATDTTAAVNEPLMKIGNYADTLSNATAIPTTEGANSITVDTTVQPSEFTATWTGWHDSSVKEWDGSDWQ